MNCFVQDNRLRYYGNFALQYIFFNLVFTTFQRICRIHLYPCYNFITTLYFTCFLHDMLGKVCCFSGYYLHFFSCQGFFLRGVSLWKQGPNHGGCTDWKSVSLRYIVLWINLNHDFSFSGRNGFPYSATPALTNTIHEKLPTKQNQQTGTTLYHLHTWKICFHLGLRKQLGHDFFVVKVESGSISLKLGCLHLFNLTLVQDWRQNRRKGTLLIVNWDRKKKDELTMDFHLRFIIIY